MKTILAVIATAFAASAFAGEITPLAAHEMVKGSKTRAEVKAELQAAQKAGWMPVGEVDVTPVAKSVKTRAQVKAELAQYIKSGQRDRDMAAMAGGN